jgi:uncharacterized caspase-like protein
MALAATVQNKWAVLVGVNGYHESLGPLRYCTNDVALMRDLLTSKICGFPPENVVVLSDAEGQPPDRQPTMGSIYSWLGEWLSRPAENDLVLVYFAGHGREVKGSVYLAPKDSTLSSIHTTGIPLKALHDLMENCRAAQKVLVLDACHSGAGRDVATMSPAFRTALDTGHGTYTIASCDSNQLSHEWSDQQHGVFTHYLVEAVQAGARPDEDGRLTLDSIYEWARTRISQWCAEHRVHQDPVRHASGAGQIVIGKRGVYDEKFVAGLQAEITRLSALCGRQGRAAKTLQEENERLKAKSGQMLDQERLGLEKDRQIATLRQTVTDLEKKNRELDAKAKAPRGLELVGLNRQVVVPELGAHLKGWTVRQWPFLLTFLLLSLFYFLSDELFRKVAGPFGPDGKGYADWDHAWKFALIFGLAGGSGLVTALIALLGNKCLGWKSRVLWWRAGITYVAILFMGLAVGVYSGTGPLMLMPLMAILLLVPAEVSVTTSLRELTAAGPRESAGEGPEITEGLPEANAAHRPAESDASATDSSSTDAPMDV